MSEETTTDWQGRVEARLDSIEATGDATYLQTTKTNGRVTRLEHIIEGDPSRRLPSGARDRGLVGDVFDHGQIIGTVKSAISVGKWLVATFGALALALIANLVTNLL